jgi:hypothetical protein
VDLTLAGRVALAALALVVAGFALGSLVGLRLAPEHALAMLSGAGGALILAARRTPKRPPRDDPWGGDVL